MYLIHFLYVFKRLPTSSSSSFSVFFSHLFNLCTQSTHFSCLSVYLEVLVPPVIICVLVIIHGCLIWPLIVWVWLDTPPYQTPFLSILQSSQLKGDVANLSPPCLPSFKLFICLDLSKPNICYNFSVVCKTIKILCCMLKVLIYQIYAALPTVS